MAFENFHRYIQTSVVKHLLDSATSDSLQLVVNSASKRTPTWETADTNIEADIEGPVFRPTSGAGYHVTLGVTMIVSSLIEELSSVYIHQDRVGLASKWLNTCILVKDYPTDSLTVTTLMPDNGDDGIQLLTDRPTRTDDRFHTTISGLYRAKIRE